MNRLSVSEHARGYWLLIVSLSLFPLVVHFLVNAFTAYGIFRDEFYYISCSEHPASGYVDQPPLSIIILFVSRLLFGDSLFALRILPSIASALTVLFTCLIVMRIGGGKSAIVIAAVSMILAPIYLGMFAIYSMNAFDILLCTIAAYIITLIIIEDKMKLWILLGVILGLGLLNKVGFLWISFGFFVGLIMTDKRNVFLTSKPYVTALTALLIFLPYIIWNFLNDFAHIEFIRNATSGKYSTLTRLDFIKGQLLNLNPLSVIVWISGLYYFLIDSSGKKFRILGYIFLISFAVLLINGHSKAEYLASAYPALFAGGGVMIEKLSRKKFRTAGAVVTVIIAASGILLSPLAIQILPVRTFIEYSRKLGLAPSTSENNELAELPQHYADMFGWEEFAKEVSDVYLKIPEGERSRVLFFGRNYGEAGAVNYYSKRYPLPDAISGHNNYWLWKYKQVEDPIIIIAGGDSSEHSETFKTVEQKGFHSVKYAMPYENNLPIYVLRNLKQPMNQIWERTKNYE